MNDKQINGALAAHLVFWGVLAPLAAALFIQGISAEFRNISNIIAMVAHVTFAITCLPVIICGKAIFRTSTRLELTAPIAAFLLMSSIATISVIRNGASLELVGRLFLVYLFIFNYCVVARLVAREVNVRKFQLTLGKNILYGIYVLCAIAIYYFYFGDTPYVRLGYPFIPGVFAYYATFGLILLLGFKQRSLGGQCFLFFCILASGSRFAIVVSVLAFLLFRFGQRSTPIRSFVFVSFVVAASIGWADPFRIAYRVFSIARDDVSSARFDIWNQSLELIKENLVLGVGFPPAFSLNGEQLRAHNTFLDLSGTYGVFYSSIAYLVWFFLFFPRSFRSQGGGRGSTKYDDIYKCQLALFWLVTLKSFITTTFWTNMGDAVTIAILIFLLSGRAQRRDAAETSDALPARG